MMSESTSGRTVEYEYTKLVGAKEMRADRRFAATLGFDWEIWVGSDGSGLRRESRGPIDFFTDEGRLCWEAAGSPVLERDRGVELYAPGCTSGPRSMRSQVINHRGGLAAAMREIGLPTLKPIRDLLGEGVVDPGFCRAVFAVAQQIRGVASLDAVVDQTGRCGPGLTQIVGRHRFELIFSSDLGELLGYQNFSAQPMDSAPAGTLQSWGAYLERRTEHSLPADVPPVPRRRGERARGRGLLIRPGLSVVTGLSEDPLKQLADLHADGVLTDADYESAKVMQAWAGFDDATALAWRALGMRPTEAVELTQAGHRPAELGALWERTGIPADEIAEWIGAGVTPSEAVNQRAQGVTADDAAAMRGLRGLDRRG